MLVVYTVLYFHLLSESTYCCRLVGEKNRLVMTCVDRERM